MQPGIPSKPGHTGHTGPVQVIARIAERRGMIAERILMGLLLGGVAIGCVLVLYPFLSALLWAGILVYTTWPLYDRLAHRMRRGPAAIAMVALTAIVLVLPIGLAAPGSADDVTHLRHVVMASLRAGLPGAPMWVFDIPLLGSTLGTLWNSWAADVSSMLEAFRPYFGIL